MSYISMMRAILGCVGSVAVVLALIYTRSGTGASFAFVSANMPGLSGITMAVCSTAVGSTNREAANGNLNAAAAVASSANTGKVGNPFYVLAGDKLNTATTLGGCLCGTSVCTIGRICDEPNSMCFIPPCPLDGLSGTDAGKKTVPAVYSAGCWCAKKELFSTDYVHADLAEAPFRPSGPAFADTKQAKICKVGEYCYAEAGEPECSVAARTA